MSWTGFNWTDQHPRFVVDITGDGRADIVGLGRDGVWASLNSRGDGIMQIPRLALRGFGENAGSWHVDRHPRVLGDVTGEGRADIVGFGDAGVYVALSNGDGSFTMAAGIAGFGIDQGWRVDQHPRFLADVTGDGRADIVGFGNDGVYVALSNGDGSFTMAAGIADFGVDQGWRVDRHPRFLADVTGDGRADIVAFGDNNVYVALSNGDGTFQTPVWGIGDLCFNQGWRTDQHPRLLADVTGDGRADIVGFGGEGVYIALSNGNGTFSLAGGVADFGLDQGWRIGKHPRFLADVTGNGRADIVGFADDGVWVSLGNGDGTFRPAQFVLADYSVTSTVSLLKHVFVLMLENRSFDHMLGHSGIKGTDAETGAPTAIDGLTGAESNSFHGESFAVSTGAKAKMPHDPGHSFDAQLIQLCGYGAEYPPGGPYPPIDNSGFATSYGLGEDRDPADVMRGYAEDDLPYLHQLAREFVVCDRWFASHPGHTWPNRVFVHAATSGGMDMQPSNLQIVNWSINHFAGLELAHGTIYDRLDDAGLAKQIYAGDPYPMVATLAGVSRKYDVLFFDRNFETDLHDQSLWDDAGVVHIEPDYDSVFGGFANGTSQHPCSDVRHGDLLIKRTYEAIRNSPLWEQSMLIIIWDEAGGFYDHVPPPAAVPPGDPQADDVTNEHQFAFDQLGPRVPAVVISPLIPKNLVDHRVYDHASVLATIEHAFGLPSLTERDRLANSLTTLVSLQEPRQDTPATLVTPDGYEQPPALRLDRNPAHVPNVPIDGPLPGFLYSAVVQDFALRDPSHYDEIRATVASIKTQRDAAIYMDDVAKRMAAKRQQPMTSARNS